MARLAIFDIDGTLIPGASSEVRFVHYLRRRRVLGVRQWLAYGWFFLRYAPRFRQHVTKKNKAWLTGLEKHRVHALAGEFVHTELQPILHAPTLKRLRAHQAAGDVVVLLSGTPQFLAAALAQALHAKASYGALCSIGGDDIFRAAPPTRHPYGASKVAGAEALAAAAGLPLATAVAYGDSVHDAYLFRRVGEAVAVQPDRGLQAVASGEGWEVMPD
ncbi:MAG TPA: HAD-IB family hydrolase [Salinisphaeraceae bacterium]|nr:HAD-IB family hydrolase [Salinisphaeraceae bacterium]